MRVPASGYPAHVPGAGTQPGRAGAGPRATDGHAELPGHIGRFAVRRVLGRGTQSVVYLAHDPMLERAVAIKALPATRGADAPQLLAEARIAGRLRHPHIVPAFDVGEHDGHPYLVFEFIDGCTLADVLRTDGALAPARAVSIMIGMLDAIAHAHAQAIVHRDLKPANVMIDGEDFPRVMDFGIAVRAVGGGASERPDVRLVGTPAYMAPEYVRTGASAPSNDIFACGLLLAEMLTGRRVIVAASVAEAIGVLLDDPIELPDAPHPIDERLSAIARKAIAREPGERFASAAQMKDALARWLARADAVEPVASGERDSNSTLEFLFRRMRHRTDFPALSAAISAVNRALAADSENISSLANTILQDFAITNKILRVVNSAGFGGMSSGRISTISRAVQILGFDQVRNITTSLILVERLQNRAQADALRDEFVKALFAGVLAREVAPRAGLRDCEEAFVCALFRNLGRLLCLFYFPEEWQEIQRLLRDERHDENAAARRVLGASFERLGVGTAEAWRFPARIVHSMRALPGGHLRKLTSDDEGLKVVSGLAAEISAAACGPEAERDAALALISSRYREALALDREEIVALVRQALGSLCAYASALGIDLARSPLGRTLISLGATANDAPGAARTGTVVPAADTTGMTVLGEATSALAHGSAVARDPQAALSAGIEDLSSALLDGVPVNEVLRIVLETMYRAMGFRRVVLCIRDAKENTMTGRFGFGEDAQTVCSHFRFRLDATPDVFSVAIAKNADILITDADDPQIAARVPAWYRDAVGARTFIVFPLVVNAKPFGMIYADAHGIGGLDLSPSVLKLLRTLRNQAVLAIRQVR